MSLQSLKPRNFPLLGLGPERSCHAWKMALFIMLGKLIFKMTFAALNISLDES
jgi:hypothetical protein